MTHDVAASLALFLPTAGLSGAYSRRVSLIFSASFLIVAPIEFSRATLEANHPLRIGLPFIFGAIAYSEMVRAGWSWGRVERAWLMGMATFALAGVDLAALFFHELGGTWIVPGFTVAVCLFICFVALIPKGVFPWLQS